MSAPSISRRQVVLLAVLTLLWGLNWPVMKFSLREVEPLTFRALTMSGGAFVLAAWFAARGVSLSLPRAQLGRVIGLALPNIVGWHLATIIGLTLLPAGRAVILAFTMPVWTVLLGALLFGQALTRRAGVASTCALAAFFVNLSPLFTALLSAWLLGEWPQPYHAVAFVLIVAGILVSARRSP